MSKDLNKCPKCGSMAKTFLYSTITAIYRPAVYDEEGNPVNFTNPNTTTNHYTCANCGESYESKQ